MLAPTDSIITKAVLDSAMSYDTYMSLLIDLMAEEKTTGNDQSESMVGYRKMNVQRMKRLNKNIQLQPELLQVLKGFNRKVTFLVITEGWCGDAAQNVPVFNKLLEYTNEIDLKLILRDENLKIMDAFLTSGGRSIPKLIALDSATLKLLGSWGPRPEAAQFMVTEFKKIDNGDYSEFVKEVQLWYARDKTFSMQNELVDLLKAWNK
ncbi:thioredoxin family protein [Vicingaceae bacterium]|nr:thioredoxin family protein [Vicingaceae bacterium]MDB4083022.1 thioredoxin family protein [Vicingaceae bacterium]